MKYLKTYESHKDSDFFEKSKLSDFLDKEREFNIQKNNILSLINEYIKINKEYFLNEYDIKPDQKNFSIEIVNDPPYDRLSMLLLSTGWKRYLNQIDFKKMVEFIDEPDLYIKSHKYNL